MSRRSAAEREVVCTIADDEDAWHIFTASARLTSRLLRVAEQWGVTPSRCGVGFELTLPLAALRFSGPRRVTEARKAQLAQARASRQKARLGAGEPVATAFPAGRQGEGVS